MSSNIKGSGSRLLKHTHDVRERTLMINLKIFHKRITKIRKVPLHQEVKQFKSRSTG